MGIDGNHKVLALDIDFHKVKVEQNGLPISGRELEIVRDLALKRSHLLLVELAERGAFDQRAVMLAIRQFVEEKQVHKEDYSRFCVTERDFEQAREELLHT